jgi:hypothetical protein
MSGWFDVIRFAAHPAAARFVGFTARIAWRRHYIDGASM